MNKKVTVRKDVCVGCGICTNISDILIIGIDGLAEATIEVVPEDKELALEEAANACPLKAIEIEE